MPDKKQNLETPHVFLDTEMYRRISFNFKHGHWIEFEKRLSAKKLYLHTTDISFAECLKKVAEESGTAIKEYTSTVRNFKKWYKKSIGEIDKNFPEIDLEKYKKIAMDKFAQKLSS